jgi:hypothetical protein
LSNFPRLPGLVEGSVNGSRFVAGLACDFLADEFVLSLINPIAYHQVCVRVHAMLGVALATHIACFAVHLFDKLAKNLKYGKWVMMEIGTLSSLNFTLFTGWCLDKLAKNLKYGKRVMMEIGTLSSLNFTLFTGCDWCLDKLAKNLKYGKRVMMEIGTLSSLNFTLFTGCDWSLINLIA